MKKILVITGLLGVLLFSCQRKNRPVPTIDVLTQFADSVRLSDPEPVVSDLLNPTGLVVSDSFIAVGEYQSDPMIRLYDLTGRQVAEFLRKGRGPGETSNLVDVAAYDDRTIQAFVDPESVFLYDVDDLLDGELLPSKVYELPNQSFSPCVHCGEDDFFYAGKVLENQDAADKRFCIYRVNSGRVDTFGEYPAEDVAIRTFPKDDYSRLLTYQGDPDVKPDHSKAVFAYYYAVGFDIIDLDSAKIERSVFYQYPQVELSYVSQLKANFIKRDMDSFRGFLDVWCSDDHIYFLYSGKKFSAPDFNLGRYILKYDWKGKPIGMYLLNKEVGCIALDKSEKYLYAGLIEEDGGTIVRYNLN